MKPSRSQFIALESIPMGELFKSEPGAMGLYLPSPDADGKIQTSVTRISSAAKRWGTVENKHSVVQTAIMLVTHQGDELPTPQKLVQITVISADEISPKGRIFRESKKAKREAKA